MLDPHVRLMRTYMMQTLVAAGFAPGDVSWEEQGRYFTIAGSTVEVALGRGAHDGAWELREVYDLADLQEGGVRPTVSVVSRHPQGDERTVARRAAMLAVERRIDLALEESA